VKRKISITLVIVLLIGLSMTNEKAQAQDSLADIIMESWKTGVNGDAETLVIGKPVGVKTGEVLVAQITYEKGRDALPIQEPEGWILIINTEAYSGGGYKDIGQAIYIKVATTNESESYTWRFSQKVKALGGIVRYSGVNPENPVISYAGRGGYGSTTGQNMLNAPSLQVIAGAKIVGFYGIKESALLDSPIGMDIIYEEWDLDNDYSILLTEETVSKNGASGEKTSYSWEYDKRSESIEAEWVAQIIQLRPKVVRDASANQYSEEIRVYINRQRLLLTDQPFIEQGRTLIPMRAFFEALGAEVDWDPVNRIASGTRGGITIRIPIDSKSPTVNGTLKEIDVPARIVNNRTYIPLRFVGEALGEEVEWNGNTRSIFITSQ
jgi:hypothetical protein